MIIRVSMLNALSSSSAAWHIFCSISLENHHPTITHLSDTQTNSFTQTLTELTSTSCQGEAWFSSVHVPALHFRDLMDPPYIHHFKKSTSRELRRRLHQSYTDSEIVHHSAAHSFTSYRRSQPSFTHPASTTKPRRRDRISGKHLVRRYNTSRWWWVTSVTKRQTNCFFFSTFSPHK